MSGLATKLRTAWALGPANIARVAAYRGALRLGIHPAQRIRPPQSPVAPFYAGSQLASISASTADDWTSGHLLFGHLNLPASSQPPDWHKSLASNQMADATSDWWHIPDFDSALGDIKPVWELSRMAWVLPFVQRARNGNREALSLLNGWLADWLARNPPYKGVNWKCGQEASIRVMHLAMAAHILGQLHSPLPALLQLIEIHLHRIAPTISYARAQDNNHGTSEAAALFLGGLMLGEKGVSWRDSGRRLLEERVACIVMDDGSFSQQSLVYQRLLLDALSLAELARREFGVSSFSPLLIKRARAALEWMRAMIDPRTGDGPNLGANDSAHILPLTNLPTRDFRPSLQLAAAMFTGARATAESGPWDDALAWLAVSQPAPSLAAASSRVADYGGFAVLRAGKAMAMLRYPRFRFRPSQADVLHADLRVDGVNWLSDAGTYSYNTDAATMAYFNGTRSHNTIEFDGRSQMPQLGRFLFGDWLKAESAGPLQETDGAVSFAASYRDNEGAQHRRAVTLTNSSLRVEDSISGFHERAVLRWRLLPVAWKLSRRGNDSLSLAPSASGAMRMTVTSSVPLQSAELAEGWRSLNYLEKQPVPVLEIEVKEPARIETVVEWAT